MLFLPELSLLGAGLALFLFSLGKPGSGTIKTLALFLATVTFFVSILCINSEGTLFYSSYKVDFAALKLSRDEVGGKIQALDACLRYRSSVAQFHVYTSQLVPKEPFWA